MEGKHAGVQGGMIRTSPERCGSSGVLEKECSGSWRADSPLTPSPHLGSTSGACVGVPQALEHKLAREPWGGGGVFGGGGLDGGWAHPCAILAQAGATASPPPKGEEDYCPPTRTSTKLNLKLSFSGPSHVPGQPPSPRRQGEPRGPESSMSPDSPLLPEGRADHVVPSPEHAHQEDHVSSPDGPLLPEGWANPGNTASPSRRPRSSPNGLRLRTAPFSQKAGQTQAAPRLHQEDRVRLQTAPFCRKAGKPWQRRVSTAMRPSSTSGSARLRAAPVSQKAMRTHVRRIWRKRPESGAVPSRAPRASPRLRTAPFSQKAGQAMARDRPAPLSRAHRLLPPSRPSLSENKEDNSLPARILAQWSSTRP